MKVFLVRAGEYEQVYIAGVFSSFEKAQQWIAENTPKSDPNRYDGPRDEFDCFEVNNPDFDPEIEQAKAKKAPK